jgi:PAS domain S-box-containing protein
MPGFWDRFRNLIHIEIHDATRQSSIVVKILAVYTPLAISLTMIGFMTDTPTRLVTTISISLFFWPVGSIILLRARLFHIAAIFLVYGLAIESFFVTILLGGLFSLSYFAYANVIITSGLVLNRRHTIFLTIVGILGFFIVRLMEQTGLLSQVVPYDSFLSWAAATVIFIWVAIVLLAYIQFNEKSLERAHREIEARHSTEADLARQAAVVEQSSEAILITDMQGKITYVNPNFERLTGYSLREIAGKNPNTLKSGAQDETLYNDLWSTIIAGNAWRGVLINRKKSGELYHEEKSIFAIRDVEGHMINYASVGHDITTRIAAEQRLRQYAGRLEILHEIEQAILRAQGPTEIAATTLIRLRRLVLLKRASVALFDEKNQTALVYAVDTDQQSKLSPDIRLPLSSFASYKHLERNQHYTVEDLLALPEPTPVEAQLIEEGIRGYITTPLFYQDKILGALNVGKAIPGAFDPDTVAIIREVGDMLAVAIQNARLFEETRQQTRQLASLYDTALDLASTLDTSDLVNRLSAQIHLLLEPDGLLVASYTQNREALKILLAINAGTPVPELEGKIIKSTDEGLVSMIARQRQSVLIDDLQFASLPVEALPIEKNGRSWLGVPMVALDQVVGVLAVYSGQSGVYAETHRKLLTSLAAQAAIALENARLFEEERQRSRTKAAVAGLSTDFGFMNNRHEILSTSLRHVNELTSCKGAAFLMRTANPGQLKVELATGNWEGLKNMTFHAGEIAIGLVANLRRTYMIHDTRSDDRLIRKDILGDSQSIILLPLIPQIDSLGFLMLGRDRTFEATEIQMLEALAEVAAPAIQRAEMFEETQRRLGQVLALHNIDQAITTNQDLDIVMRVVLEQVTIQLQVQAATILLVDDPSQSLKTAARWGFKTGALEHTHLKIGEGYAGKAALSQQIVHVPDLLATPGEFNRSSLLNFEGLKSYYAVPLVTKNKIKGVLELFQRDSFEPDEEWYTFLETIAVHAAVAIDNADLFRELQQSNQEIMLAYDHALEGWSKALELRDQETEGHSRRVTEFTLALAGKLGIQAHELKHIRRGALLHDIGKMGISDQILLKPGPLDEAEWQEMRMHPIYAYRLLSPIPYLQPALDIPYSHHERWDGSGYPLGLKGEEIPLAARIFAVIDVYDALISHRPYRPAWSPGQAKEYLLLNAGILFDPKIVNAFLELAQQD